MTAVCYLVLFSSVCVCVCVCLRVLTMFFYIFAAPFYWRKKYVAYVSLPQCDSFTLPNQTTARRHDGSR